MQDGDEMDLTPPILPNCPKCLHPTEGYDGDLFAGWVCPACGEVILIEEVTHPHWWASVTTGWKPEHGIAGRA